MHSFSSSKPYLAGKKLRMVAKMSKGHAEVRDKVAETLEALGSGLDISITL